MSLPRGFTSPPPVASTSAAQLASLPRLVPSRPRQDSYSSQTTTRDSPLLRSPGSVTPTLPEWFPRPAGSASRTSLAPLSPAELSRTPSQSKPAPSPPMRQASGSGTPWDSGPEGSGRASPAMSTKSFTGHAGRPTGGGRSAGSGGYATRNLESYSSRHVAAALEAGEGAAGREAVGEDVWSLVCVRVLPLL